MKTFTVAIFSLTLENFSDVLIHGVRTQTSDEAKIEGLLKLANEDINEFNFYLRAISNKELAITVLEHMI